MGSVFWYTKRMKQVDTISVAELSEMAAKMYGNLVKAVADVKLGVMIVDAEMHADEEQYLLENGSQQADLWGFNLYPEKFGTDEFVEFDSMINIRPSQNNMSRDVHDETVRSQIIDIVNNKVSKWRQATP